MKKIVIISLFLFGCVNAQAQFPNFDEWFRQKKTQRKYLVRQIVALKVYLGYLKKGYEIADNGLTLISDIKGGTFSLDRDYLNSLKQVSPVIRNSPKVKAITSLQQRIIRDFRKLLDDCRQDGNFTPDEVRYIEKVYESMLEACNRSVDELAIVLTPGETGMKDDERLQRLDTIYADMSDRYTFTQSFASSARLLSVQRARERNEIERYEKLIMEL